MKKILIISHSQIAIDPRVYKQVMAFIADCEVHVLGPDPFPDKRVHFHDINIQVADRSTIIHKLQRLPGYIFNRFAYSYFRNPGVNYNLQTLRALQFDLVINNEVFTLPFALALKTRRTHIHFDAHEYYFSYFEEAGADKAKKAYLDMILEKYVPGVDSFSTVCNGIAQLYRQKYKMPVAVAENLPLRQQVDPAATGEIIQLVHHGSCLRDRRLELMIDIMRFLPSGKYAFHLYLTKNQPAYLQELMQSAKDLPHVYFHDPVDMTAIVSEISRYDIGLFVLPHTTENYRFALPNKFFEFIQARLMVVVSAGEEMPAIVHAHNLGQVLQSMEPAEMAKQIAAVSHEEIMQHKANAHKAAPYFSAQRVMDYYRDLLK